MKKSILYLLLCSVFSMYAAVSCSRQTGTAGLQSAQKNEKQASAQPASPFPPLSAAEAEYITDRLDNMTAEEKISQLLFIGIDGKAVLPVYTASFLEEVRPGGILLFRGNIADSPSSVINFTDSIYRCFNSGSSVFPFIGIDQEGGTVNRLTPLSVVLPSAEETALKAEPAQAELLYGHTARQLASLGITFNFAPVAEHATDINRSVLGTRCFNADAGITLAYASAFIGAMKTAAVFSAAKHFPGNVSDDPHNGLPVLDITERELWTDYINPFADVLAAEPEAVVMSHIVVPCIEEGVPSCLSSGMVRGILRDNLGYKGLIISDDIRMAALEKNGFPSEHAAEAALRAGVTMILISGGDIKAVRNYLAAVAGTDSSFSAIIDTAVYLVLRAKLHAGLLNGTAYPFTADAAVRAEEFTKGRDAGRALAEIILEKK